MIEAAMVIPVFLLTILTLVLCMIHQYECHKTQIEIHEQLLHAWDASGKIIDIETRKVEKSSEIRGMVFQWLSTEKESRIYLYSPSEYIRLGEMLSFDEE